MFSKPENNNRHVIITCHAWCQHLTNSHHHVVFCQKINYVQTPDFFNQKFTIHNNNKKISKWPMAMGEMGHGPQKKRNIKFLEIYNLYFISHDIDILYETETNRIYQQHCIFVQHPKHLIPMNKIYCFSSVFPSLQQKWPKHYSMEETSSSVFTL